MGQNEIIVQAGHPYRTGRIVTVGIHHESVEALAARCAHNPRDG